MARRILGVLLAAMAIGQLVDLPAFVDILETYEFGGRVLAWLLALTLIAGESVGAVGLLRPTDGDRYTASVVALAVAVVWSVLAVQAFARNLVVPNCGCFGRFLGQELRWWILLEDAEFVLLGIFAVRASGRARDEASAPTVAADRD